VSELRIPVERLRAVVDLLMRRIAETAGDSVSLEQDYFWSISPDSLYNVYEEPGELGVGQLSESWQHLESLLKDESDAAIPYHLVWLADIIRAIGHEQTRKPHA